MTTLIQFVLAAAIAIAAAAPSIAAGDEEPRREACDMTLSVGHVPGRLEPVWMLRCPA